MSRASSDPSELRGRINRAISVGDPVAAHALLAQLAPPDWIERDVAVERSAP